MNKWKTAFVISLISLIILLLSGFLYIVNTEMKLGYKVDYFKNFKSDYDKILIIYNMKLKTKKEIEFEFKKIDNIPFEDQIGDTVLLTQTDLIFKNDTLMNIKQRK